MKAISTRRLAAGATLLAVAASTAVAIPVDPREINLAAGSLLVDAEVAMMSRYVGQDTAILSYGAIVGADGWRGRLVGSYAGYAVDIGYVGNSTAGPGGTREIAFNSSATLTCLNPANCMDSSWYDTGTWIYGNEIDPPDKTTATLAPKLDANGTPIGFQIGGGIGNGIWSLSADIEKDFAQHVFTASVTGSVLDGLASAGGNFRYIQADAAKDPGTDSSELFAKALFGLWKWKKTVDTSRVVTPPQLPAEVPTPPALPPQDLEKTGTLPPPADPANDYAGFTPPDPDDGSLAPGVESMYVQNRYDAVPEPASAALALAALAGLLGVRRYATSSSATRTSAASCPPSDRS